MSGAEFVEGHSLCRSAVVSFGHSVIRLQYLIQGRSCHVWGGQVNKHATTGAAYSPRKFFEFRG